MKIIKYKRIIAVILCFVVFISPFSNINIKSANTAESKNGTITFETIDTIAKTGIRWSTVGFTVRRDKCVPSPFNGDPRHDTNYATLLFDSTCKKTQKDNLDGTYTVKQ